MAVPITIPFKASLLNSDKCSSLELSCDCSSISFQDSSNYTTNDMDGHSSSLFTSRTITITKPDGGVYVMATSDVASADKVILPHASSNNKFTYNFTDTDEDGLYQVRLCTYPDWDSTVTYIKNVKSIVLRSGKLYECVANSTNVDPATDTDSVFWAEYTDPGACSDTRYCTTQTIVVTCISIDDCYRKAVAEAFCGMQKNPCKDMCDNKEFMKAMKMRVVMDGLEFAACGFDWDNAQDHVDILKSICCCK
mgnify:FL=1